MKKEKTNQTKEREVINWWNMFIIFILAIIMSIVGMSLPLTINKINGLSPDAVYGIWVSYCISMILFWVIARQFKLTKLK